LRPVWLKVFPLTCTISQLYNVQIVIRMGEAMPAPVND
jgi:hypothetical protein